LAAGLKPHYRRGQILVARAVRSAQDPCVVQSDAYLLRRAVACGAKAVDLFHTSETVVLTPEEKSRLGTFADAVEMESFIIMTEATACGVPAVAIRAIGDTVGVDVPLDFDQALGERGRVSVPLLLAQLVKHPSRLPGLIRFGFESCRASVLLARFLNRYIEVLAEQKEQMHVPSHVVAV
jgi:adenosylhomocysteine nucleosidase